jgi:hypothetical protein
MRASHRCSCPSRRNQTGFATAAVLVLLIVSAIAGAYMLKSSKHRAATVSNFFQARSAAFAAQAGLAAGLADFEAQSALSTQRLNNYLADTAKAWLLGGVGKAGSATWVDLGGGNQSYATRILGFDPSTGLIKLASDGRGPGGSESRAYGVFQLQGIKPKSTEPNFAWYMAGDARNVDQAVDVEGNTFFGGDVHFNGGADGSVFRGTVKIARGAGGTSIFSARVDFNENVYFEAPIKTQGGGLYFYKNAGFEDNVFAETNMRMGASAQNAYFNGNINQGNAGMDMGGKNLFDNGNLNMARVLNAGQITHQAGTIPIASKLGMTPGIEPEISVDISSIPANRFFTLSSLGFAAGGVTDGADLSNAYLSAKASGRLYNDFLCLNVGSLNFSTTSTATLKGKFLFSVSGGMNVNGHFPICDPTCVCFIHVVSGSVNGFGSNGLFRGFVHAAGTGSIIYEWGPGAELRGALHHVTATAGFQMNTSATPLKLIYDAGVFDEIEPLHVIVPPGGTQPSVKPQIKLVDTRIRPKFLSRYF